MGGGNGVAGQARLSGRIEFAATASFAVDRIVAVEDDHIIAMVGLSTRTRS
jgi:hypothetical protein